MDDFYNELLSLKKKVENLLDKEKESLDIYDINALNFMSAYLGELAYEYRTGKLKPKDKRFDYLAWMLSDRDTSLISAELGDQLIKVEQKYIAL